MLLTGKLSTGILGTGVLLLIGPATYWVLKALPQVFWKTYVADWESRTNIAAYTSSAGSFCAATARMYEWLSGSDTKLHIQIPLFTAVMAGLVLAVLCIWLVKKRPSEGAEHAMAFPQTEGVIKACILYVLGLGGGLFFMMLGAFRNGEESNAWFWFGIIFSLILGSIIIEIIYHFDRRMLLGHKVWTGISIAAVLTTAVVFVFDLPGYDSWVPDEKDVTNATMWSGNTYFAYPDGSKTLAEYMEKHLDEMKGEGLTELAAEGVKYTDTDETGTFVTMLFKMKNGSVKKRQYVLSERAIAKEEEKLYREETYKEAIYPLLLDTAGYEVKSIESMGQEESLTYLAQEQKEKLIEIYIEELRKLDYSQIHTPDSGIICFSKEGSSYEYEYYNLNENFPETMEYLEKNGIQLMKTMDEANIISMEFYEDTGDFEKEAQQSIIITDPEIISEARKNLVCINRYEGLNERWNLEESLSVWVTYRTPNNDVVDIICYYEKGKLPEAVKSILQK